MGKKSYQEIIDVTVAGIPCQVGIIDFSHVPGSYSRNEDSDWDYYGYSDSDWELLDRKGYVAGRWLTDKMTKSDIAQIEEEIFEAMTQQFDN